MMITLTGTLLAVTAGAYFCLRTKLRIRKTAGFGILVLQIIFTSAFVVACLYTVSMSYGSIGEFISLSLVDVWDRVRLGYFVSRWQDSLTAVMSAGSPLLIAGGLSAIGLSIGDWFFDTQNKP